MQRIQVGLSKIQDQVTGKERVSKYSDIPKLLGLDINIWDGWVYDLAYLPIPFDLMHLKVQEEPRIYSGWWTGQDWDGLRLKDEYTTYAWKRNHDHD